MSALNVTGAIGGSYQVTENLPFGLKSASIQDQLTPALSFDNGTGSGQINQRWSVASVTLAASATQTYTLSALTDTLGRTIPLVKVRAIVLSVISRTAGDYLKLGLAGTHPWAALFNSTGDGLIVWDLLVLGVGKTDGYAVTSGSSDQLKIANAGSNSITFQLAFLGTDA